MVKVVHTERSVVYSTTEAELELMRLNATVVKLVWRGLFERNSVPLIRAYLQHFLSLANAHGAPLHMLHDLNDLTRYSKECLLEHTMFSLEHSKKIGRIAVISRRAMVYLGVATVAAWQKRPIRNFEDQHEALQWLEPPGPIRRCG